MRYNYTCKSAYQFSGVEVEFHSVFLSLLILTISSAFKGRAADELITRRLFGRYIVPVFNTGADDGSAARGAGPVCYSEWE